MYYSHFQCNVEAVNNSPKQYYIIILVCFRFYQVYQMVDYEFQQMALDNMRMYPILEARTRNIITNLCKEAFARCKEGLEEYMEMENMIYTQVN